MDDDDENDDDEAAKGGVGGVMSASQLMHRISQLQKVVNHPKCLLFQLARDRLQLKRDLKSAEGGQYAVARLAARQARLRVHEAGAGNALEAELRALTSDKRAAALIAASGKVYVCTHAVGCLASPLTFDGYLFFSSSSFSAPFSRGRLVFCSMSLLFYQLALLDRLLARCLAAKSRVLVFSQFTLTLDVLEEYCEARFGPKGAAFLRLDGERPLEKKTRRQKGTPKMNAKKAPRHHTHIVPTRNPNFSFFFVFLLYLRLFFLVFAFFFVGFAATTRGDQQDLSGNGRAVLQRYSLGVRLPHFHHGGRDGHQLGHRRHGGLVRHELEPAGGTRARFLGDRPEPVNDRK
jgi:hypothetical protein